MRLARGTAILHAVRSLDAMAMTLRVSLAFLLGLGALVRYAPLQRRQLFWNHSLADFSEENSFGMIFLRKIGGHPFDQHYVTFRGFLRRLLPKWHRMSSYKLLDLN